jgi:hypothetical protein
MNEPVQGCSPLAGSNHNRFRGAIMVSANLSQDDAFESLTADTVPMRRVFRRSWHDSPLAFLLVTMLAIVLGNLLTLVIVRLYVEYRIGEFQRDLQDKMERLADPPRSQTRGR